MILENVQEIWQEKVNDQIVTKDRFISKMFLRGDSVIIVIKDPK